MEIQADLKREKNRRVTGAKNNKTGELKIKFKFIYSTECL